MTDRAISETAMLTSLQDIHLPAEAAGGMAADLAVAIGLASLAALLVAGVLRALSLKRRPVSERTLKTRLAEVQKLPDAERRVALLHLMRGLAPERYAEIKGAIYQPGGGVDLATLEAEVGARV
ncbi:hypothetical protein [uncultured Roseobacter sp.]|uniref:hypothetical protein n=1 Tax=uncultured Roseobacter sp. TaxID=114847 RepID=UPI0026138CC8|nr:hypothetical protein [uncultured Roseobacter sp.]